MGRKTLYLVFKLHMPRLFLFMMVFKCRPMKAQKDRPAEQGLDAQPSQFIFYLNNNMIGYLNYIHQEAKNRLSVVVNILATVERLGWPAV